MPVRGADLHRRVSNSRAATGPDAAHCRCYAPHTSCQNRSPAHTHSRGAPTDQKRVETLTATLAKKLQGYERILEKQRYLAGDKLTLADIFHLPYGKMAVDVSGGVFDMRLPRPC